MGRLVLRVRMPDDDASEGHEQSARSSMASPTVDHWHVEGERLTLLDGGGETIAEFESRYMK